MKFKGHNSDALEQNKDLKRLILSYNLMCNTNTMMIL